MKNLEQWQGKITKSLFSIILIISFFSFTTASDLKDTFNTNEKTQTFPVLQKGMYLIIGVFQIKENAVRYANSVKIDGKSPYVARRKENTLYSVVAYDAKENLEFAREKRTELRSTRKFYDAWILYVGITLDDLLEEEKTPDLIVAEQPKEVMPKPESLKDDAPPSSQAESQDLYSYRFNVINATTLREVPGYVTLIDASRDKAMKSVSTNQVHQLKAPNSKSKEVIALCDIFGFVKEQKIFKIDDPMSSPDKGAISNSGGIITIKYELARHKVGAILTMYKVYFYTDAAIMKPESKFELNSLLSMLKENDKLEVKIHGHTNGNNAGKIVRVKESDSNYFQITDNNDKGTGSAKELSKARADIIARWLEENGIDKKRMQIKAWGGKKMIYKKTDSMAGRNVRVEIEILKD